MDPIRLECDWTVDDHMEATEMYRNQTWARRYGPNIFPVLVLIFFVLPYLKNSGVVWRPESQIPALLIALGVLFALGKMTSSIPKKIQSKIYAKETKRRKSISFVITEDNIQMTTPDSDSTLKWSTFTDWAESSNLFVLFQYRLMYIFPKRRLNEEQQSVFRELLQKKFGKQ